MTAPALPRPTGTEPCRTAPDDWFSPATPKQARELCKGCPILDACGAWALAIDEAGVWGGMTEGQRERYRAVHGITAISVAVKMTPRPRTARAS